MCHWACNAMSLHNKEDLYLKNATVRTSYLNNISFVSQFSKQLCKEVTRPRTPSLCKCCEWCNNIDRHCIFEIRARAGLLEVLPLPVSQVTLEGDCDLPSLLSCIT